MESTAITHSTVDAAERARAAFDALGRRDLSNPEQFWGPESIDDFLPVGRFQGTEAIVGYFESLFASFPEFEIEVENIVAEGMTSVVQWHATATFSGAPFMGIEPTGRRVEMRGADVIEWDDEGRVKLNTIYYDGAELARQIGMLPARDSAGDRALTTMFNGATKLRKRLRG